MVIKKLFLKIIYLKVLKQNILKYVLNFNYKNKFYFTGFVSKKYLEVRIVITLLLTKECISYFSFEQIEFTINSVIRVGNVFSNIIVKNLGKTRDEYTDINRKCMGKRFFFYFHFIYKQFIKEKKSIEHNNIILHGSRYTNCNHLLNRVI